MVRALYKSGIINNNKKLYRIILLSLDKIVSQYINNHFGYYSSTNVTSTSATIFATAGTAVAILFSCIVITLCVVFWWRRKEQRAKLSSLEQMNKDDSPFSAEEPLSLTDVKPDKSKLRIIKESELRRGGEIGRGAFGVVYKGFWVPEGEDVKIPVAIKVIRKGNSSGLHQELLDEARIMVSVVHICCIRLLAVCMSSEVSILGK
ncbi:epidermal growth factor receptor-like [Mercenaria mercenaria]|uniref:epidermal growth factor receptor-like n=1 Tax=Mercenaria mercenaria TaxID=6596 RepID=UPI00234EBD86|nr:epidermal growth factor receptor-like [Mercenaria mercenaria]